MSSHYAKLPPLLRAAGAGDDAKVKRLLKARADVNGAFTVRGVGGTTALQAACNNGHIGATRLLLKAKATLDLRDARGCSALYGACSWEQLGCAQLLLEAKALIDLPAVDGATRPP